MSKFHFLPLLSHSFTVLCLAAKLPPPQQKHLVMYIFLSPNLQLLDSGRGTQTCSTEMLLLILDGVSCHFSCHSCFWFTMDTFLSLYMFPLYACLSLDFLHCGCLLPSDVEGHPLGSESFKSWALHLNLLAFIDGLTY